ncbi:MAG TPA: hypothetical protein VF520_02695 [Thermoleophilaceae bacterium]|jgi:hypothetical protein
MSNRKEPYGDPEIVSVGEVGEITTSLGTPVGEDPPNTTRWYNANPPEAPAVPDTPSEPEPPPPAPEEPTQA